MAGPGQTPERQRMRSKWRMTVNRMTEYDSYVFIVDSVA